MDGPGCRAISRPGRSRTSTSTRSEDSRSWAKRSPRSHVTMVCQAKWTIRSQRLENVVPLRTSTADLALGAVQTGAADCVPLPSAADVLKAQLRYAWVNARLGTPKTSPRTNTSGNRRHGVGRCEGAAHRYGAGAPVSSYARTDARRRTLPVTTIAWRVIHLAAWTDIYRDWTFGDTRPRLGDFEVPGDAGCRARVAAPRRGRFHEGRRRARLRVSVRLAARRLGRISASRKSRHIDD